MLLCACGLIVLFCFVCFSCSHTGFLTRCRVPQDRHCGAHAGAVEGGGASLEVCEQGIVFFCLHMVSSEYCASYWSYVLLLVLMTHPLMNTGEMFGSSRSHGWKLFEGVQEWVDSCKAACGCLEVLEEIRSAKYIMVLRA